MEFSIWAASSISLHSLNASKHYVLVRSTEIKTNLDGPSLKSGNLLPGLPRAKDAWPPPATENAPLESVLYCWIICVSHDAVTR